MNDKSIKRNVLLAGEPGFLAEYFTACLEKEGFAVFEASEKSFVLHNPYAVFYFASRESDTDLPQILQYAKEHRVRYFYYVSRGRVKQLCYEDFILAWSESHDFAASVVRLPEPFGEGQKSDEGFMSRFFEAVHKGDTFQLHGSDTQKIPLLYAKDAAYALFSVLKQEVTEKRIVLAAEECISFTQIVLHMNSFATLPSIEISDGQEDFTVSEASCEDRDDDTYKLSCHAKYHVLDMLQPVYEWYVNAVPEVEKEEKNTEPKYKQILSKFKPYLENIAVFVLVCLLSYLQGGTPVNSATGLDICYIYITLMGIMYGKKQSMPAILPSMALLTWGLLNQREEIASIIYVPENLLHYSSYVFFGVFTGYVRDGWAGQIDSLTYKLQHFAQRYSFLQKNYEETIAIKDKLYYQIANSDDSIGWFYGIMHQLDTVEVENIFTQAAAITSRVMGTQDIAIYTMSKGQFYVRQKVRLGSKTQNLPHSRKVENTTYIRNMLETQHLFINHGLEMGAPDLAAPIVYGDEVIAIIEIYGMNFEQWSIYQQNLLAVTSRLISMAIGKAYTYEEGIQEKRFIPNTRILREEEFGKLLNGMRERAALQDNVQNMLMELGTENITCQELDSRLNGAIRQEDAVGMQSGKVELLLHDTDEQGLQLVKNRLISRGIEVKGYRELI